MYIGDDIVPYFSTDFNRTVIFVSNETLYYIFRYKHHNGDLRISEFDIDTCKLGEYV